MGDQNKVSDEIRSTVTVYVDGTIIRHESTDPLSSSYPIPPSATSLLSPLTSAFSHSDVSINPTTNLWARIFFPPSCAITTAASVRFPVVLHFHGGGFCSGSPSWRCSHFFTGNLSVASNAIWVSFAYRLAPEHRLPTGLLDCMEALEWLRCLSTTRQSRGGPISRLSSFADFRRCFISGESAGGILAYNVALRYVTGVRKCRSFCLVGMILMNPGFIREKRSNSEAARPSEMAQIDAAAKMALPEGENKDYSLLTPVVPAATETKLPRCIIFTSGDDVFYDRECEFVARMTECRQEVEGIIYKGRKHCFFSHEEFGSTPEVTDFVDKVVAFIHSTPAPDSPASAEIKSNSCLVASPHY